MHPHCAANGREACEGPELGDHLPGHHSAGHFRIDRLSMVEIQPGRRKSQMTATTTPSLPLVSVVLGTYNGGAYLREQLESILSQTYPNIEIVAVDDGSSDDTVPILKEYAAKHPAMKVFVNEHNLGFVKNFEKGCSLSVGELISLCDQDDWWMPEKVEKMADAIGDHLMIYCDSQLCDGSLGYLGRNISDIVHFESFYDCRQLCVFSRMYGHAT
jgi:glycosyltransferase involved in cell wall biosynthesis